MAKKIDCPYPRVEVIWNDAFSIDRWTDVSDIETLIEEQASREPEGTGLYLIYQNKEWVVVAGSVTHDFDDDEPITGRVWRACGIMCIPRRWVRKVRRLR